MSDGNPNEKYRSEVDPLFSAAWNQAVDFEEQKDSAASGEPSEAAAAGDQSAAPEGQGAAAATGAAVPPADGARPAALPDAAELAASLAGGDTAANDAAAAAATAGGAGAAEPGNATAAAEATGLDPEAVSTLFDTAYTAINTKMDETILAAATKEIHESIDKEFLDTLKLSPMELVGVEVPSIARGAQQGAKTKLLDSTMARDWQEGVGKILERTIEDNKNQKTNELKPMMATLQNTVDLFRGNPDILPGSKTFDPELAARFSRAAATYEIKWPNGKRIGYHGNAQPLLNELRTNLATERGATGARKEDTAAAKAAAAANQPRTPGGQFDAPQAGITSKSGQASADGTQDMSTFWNAVGMPNGGVNLNI